VATLELGKNPSALWGNSFMINVAFY